MKLFTLLGTIINNRYRQLLIPVLIATFVSMCSIPSSAKLLEATPDNINNTQASELIKDAEQHLDTFLTDEHWAAVRNLTGIARAIFIIPRGGQVGFVLGAQWGKGILMVRHHHQWSQPIFVEVNSLQLGLLAGAQSVNGVGVLLSDNALQQVIDGNYKAGGSADLTLGPGISGKAAGGSKGVEMFMVSSNSGLYFGGSFEGIQLKLDDHLNRLTYGDSFDASALAQFHLHCPQALAQSMREKLSKVGYQAVYSSPQVIRSESSTLAH
ncbi:lipid-binding SYLF domain-containing protein [Shewanella waksmanii]|uniref:lipid-binding SYLF domain-containing protein n=1 Tax=Shewanella waksmanii TaxID=213783 RepID=UPI000491DD5F|nr:lipid-binding SYLF domain-containing protein [Shewanella waksmanii]